MPLGIAFWVLMLIWFVGGMWWSGRWNQGPIVWMPDLFLFLLLALLGWKVFGPVIHA